MNDTSLFVLSLGMIGLCVSMLSVPLIIRLAHRVGALDQPAKRKVHSTPKPLLGGLAIFLGYSVCFAVAFHVRPVEDELLMRQLVGLYSASVFLLIVGIIDDINGMGAYTKLICQIAAALWIMYFDIRVRFFIDFEFLQALITIAWVVVITNSFNLLDNMDGLSGGVAGVISMLYFLLTMNLGERELSYVSLGLCGAIIGFLRYNFHPSRLFMGDAGSLFIGFQLAGISSMATYLGHGPAEILPVLTPLIVFSVPLYDTLSVMWIRTREGRSIFEADKKHFSHRLVALGMTHRQAVAEILLLTLAVGLMAILLPKLTATQGLLVLFHTVIVFLVIALLERSGALKMKELERNGDQPESGSRDGA